MEASENNIQIGKHSYDINTDHFSLKSVCVEINDMQELHKLKLLSNLNSVSLSSSNLNDEGLEIVCDIPQLNALDLQSTQITNQGLRHLHKLKKLTWLRLKENAQLTNECIPFLLQIESLQDLQIHETSVNQKGLNELAVMKSLRHIIVDIWKDNYTYEGLLQLSIAMPECKILAKGYGAFYNGEFEGKWNN